MPEWRMNDDPFIQGINGRSFCKISGKIHFLQLSDGFFIANVGDWTPVTYVGRITIPLPLPASFVYYDYPGGDDPKMGTEEDLLADLQDSSPSFFNPYNTSIFLHNGELLELHNWSYPWGPQPEEDPEA